LSVDGAGDGAPSLMKIERAAPTGAALADYTSLFARSVLGDRDADDWRRRATRGGSGVESDGHGRG